MVQAGWEGPLQLTVGPQIFFTVPGPQIYAFTNGADTPGDGMSALQNGAAAYSV